MNSTTKYFKWISLKSLTLQDTSIPSVHDEIIILIKMFEESCRNLRNPRIFYQQDLWSIKMISYKKSYSQHLFMWFVVAMLYSKKVYHQ